GAEPSVLQGRDLLARVRDPGSLGPLARALPVGADRLQRRAVASLGVVLPRRRKPGVYRALPTRGEPGLDFPGNLRLARGLNYAVSSLVGSGTRESRWMARSGGMAGCGPGGRSSACAPTDTRTTCWWSGRDATLKRSHCSTVCTTGASRCISGDARRTC